MWDQGCNHVIYIGMERVRLNALPVTAFCRFQREIQLMYKGICLLILIMDGLYHNVSVQMCFFWEWKSINLEHFSQCWLIAHERAFSPRAFCRKGLCVQLISME